MKLIHPISGEIKEKSLTEFLALFDESVHEAILASAARYPDAQAIVCFENLDMSSSEFGRRSALVVGPSNTHTLERVVDCGRLGDVPSRFQYPVALRYLDIPDYQKLKYPDEQSTQRSS